MKNLSTLARKKLVIAALEDIKARDIQAIDVRKLTAIFDWIIVASAESARQTKALARHIRDELKARGCTIVGSEGEDSGEWILVDAGDVVAHVMQPAVREYYNLEELWGEGRFDKVVNSSVPVPAKRAVRKVTKTAKTAKAATARGTKKPKAKGGVRKPRS
jgi:ribosome-associated protein